MPLKQSVGALSCAVMLTLIAGCATSRTATPAFRFQPPVFTSPPQIVECDMTRTGTEPVRSQCIVLLSKDFMNLLIELEATCVATGATKESCKVISR